MAKVPLFTIMLLFLSCAAVAAESTPSLVEMFATLPEPDRGLGQTVSACVLRAGAISSQSAPSDAPAELAAAAKEGRNPTDEEYRVIHWWFREQGRRSLDKCLGQAGVTKDGQTLVLDSFDRSAPLGVPVAKEATIIESKFELFVSDSEASARFYTSLGFAVVQQNPDGYTTLHSGPVVIALSPASIWLPRAWLRMLRRPPLGTEMVLYTRMLDSLRERLAADGYAPGPIVLQSWGLRDFRVDDADGYYVRVTEERATPG